MEINSVANENVQSLPHSFIQQSSIMKIILSNCIREKVGYLP